MSPLRERRFVLLVAGQAVNGIGSWCALVALWGYAAYRFDASPAQIAILSLTWSLAGALLGPFGGIPVDRFGPKATLIASDTFAATVALALAFTTSYWQLILLGGFIGATRASSEPALSALAPRLVDDTFLVRANAYIGAAGMSAIAFGPLLAAAAIGAWGPRGAFFADAVTYLVGNAVVLPLRLRPVEKHAPHARPNMWRELGAGFAIVRDRPFVRQVLTVSTSVYLVWGAYAVMEPIYVRDVLHRPPSTFALLQACFGVLLLANTLLVSRAGERVASLRTLQVVALATAAAAPIYVGTSSVVIAFMGIAVWGAATAWLIAPRDTLLQRATPVAAHGRVLAIDSTLRSWAHVVSLPLAALLVTVSSVRTSALVFAVLPIVGVLATRSASTRVTRVAPAVDPAH
jgi:MFS family permease